MEVYNIMRDLAERYGAMYRYLQMVSPFQRVIQAHDLPPLSVPAAVTVPATTAFRRLGADSSPP